MVVSPRTPWIEFKSLWCRPLSNGLWKVSIFSLENRNADNCPFQRLVAEINYLLLLQMSLKIKYFPKLNGVIRHLRNTPLKHWLTMTNNKIHEPQIHTHFTIPISGQNCLQDTIFWFMDMAWKNRGKCHLKTYLNLTSIIVIQYKALGSDV